MSTATIESEARHKTSQLLQCWCGSDKWNVQFRAKRGGLSRCRMCGCYQTDPPPLTDSSQSQEFYTNYYASLELNARPIADPTNSRKAGFWRVTEQLPALKSPLHSVADIGCGDGHLCAELKGAGWRQVAGIELSTVRVARARRFYPDVDFYEQPLPKAGIPKGSLDLIVSESTIEHLPEPLTLLHEVRPFLRSGGRLVVTTPNMDSGHFRFLGRRWTGMLAPHAHIFMFTASSLRRALELAGYRVEKTGSFPDEPYTFAMWRRRLLSGDVKGAVWRAHQELGTLYGRWTSQAAMLYAVGVAE